MRLKLNRTLRAALIAAISTVGFALTQASGAIASANAAGWASLEDTGWVYSTSFVGDLSTAGDSTVQFKDDSGNLITFGITSSSKKRSAYTFAVELDLSKFTTPSGTTPMVWGSDKVGFGVDSSRKVTAAIGTTNPAWSTTNTALGTTDTITIVVSTGEEGSRIHIYDAEGTLLNPVEGQRYWKGLKEGNASTDFHLVQTIKPAVTKFAVWEASSLATASETDMLNAYNAMGDFPLAPPTEFTWNGTGDSAAWDTTSTVWKSGDKDVAYVSGPTSSTIFGTEAAAKAVTVGEAITTGTMTVQDDYSFTVSQGASLNAASLVVSSGKKASFSGTGTIALGALTGAIDIAEGTTVTTTGTVTLSGTSTLAVSGKGTLGVTTLKVTGGTHTITNGLNVTGGGDGKGSANRSLGLAVTGGTVTLEGNTHISGALYDAAGTVNIGNGTNAVRVTTNRLEFGDASGSSASILNVNKNATLYIKGEDKTNSYAETALVMGEWNGVSTANIAGKLYADNATAYVGDSTVTFNIENGGVMAVKGLSQNQHKGDKTETINLNLNGGKLVLGANGIASQKPINISLAGGEVGISANSVTIAKDVTLSGNTSFNTAMYVWQGADDTRELVAGTTGGTLTITGNITGNGAVVKNGEGTLVLSGANNVLNSSIVANAGSVTLSGGYEIGGINSSGGTEYTGGQHEGNGYATATGDIKVYITRGTGTVDATNATFTYRGKDVTVTNGVYTLPGEQDTTTYFINEETDSYSWIDTNKKGELTGGIVVAEDATLRADKDMNMSLVAASSKGTVQIDSGVVVTAAGGTQTVTLAGSGTYALASGTAALGDVTLGEGWTGNVRISGNNTSGDWNALAKQGSKLELYGVTGYAKQWAAEAAGYGSIDVDVVLTNDGDKAAFTATAGSAGTAFTTKFTKSVSGTGTFAASAMNATGGAIKENYEFSGDISGWTGEFLLVKGEDTKVTFSGAADRIKSKVNRNNGSLAMVVNTTRDAVFSQEVDVTATTLVRDGGCTQFTQAAKLGNLSGAGDIEANADLTIGGTSGYTGEIQTDSGTSLTVTGAADLSGAKLLASGDVIVAEGASLTLTEGSTIKNVIQNSGTVTLTGLTLGTEYFTETQGSEGAHFGLDDQVTEGANYFTGTSASYVLVVDGGTSTGSGLTWGELANQGLTDGKIITKAAVIDHTSFHVGGEVSTSDINKVSGVENINVVSGGNLHVDAVSEATIHAESGATVQGEQAQALVKIGENQTVTYADGIKVSDNDSAQFSGDVQVTNAGSETTFSVTNTAMEVQAETLTYGEGATSTLQIVCGVDVDNVINQSGQDLILNTLVASELDNVSALSGDIVLVSTQGDLTINNLVINAEQAVQAVEIVSGQTPEVIVTVTETLAAGNGTLLANLTMVGDSTLDVRGGGDNALTLGSTLTMNTTTGLINLDNDTLIALDALELGQRLTLVKALDNTTLAYGDQYDDMWYGGMFNREGSQYTLAGDFQVFADADSFGLMKVSNMPEPATGTLSLLALAALAARRRRK